MSNETKYYLLKGDEGNTVAVIASGDDFEDRLKKAISEEYCGDEVTGLLYPYHDMEDLHSRVGFTITIEAEMVLDDLDDGVRNFTLEQVILY